MDVSIREVGKLTYLPLGSVPLHILTQVLDSSSANRCLLKVAAYAAQLEQYQKAIEIYEQVSVYTRFIKWTI